MPKQSTEQTDHEIELSPTQVTALIDLELNPLDQSIPSEEEIEAILRCQED